jgi:hypothetical protein
MTDRESTLRELADRAREHDAVAIEAGTRRGIRADEGERLEALLVTAPPPTDAEHDPVRRGLRNDEFEPELERAAADEPEVSH